MYLSYEGKILYDGATVSDYRMINGSRVYCSFRLLGGGNKSSSGESRDAYSDDDNHAAAQCGTDYGADYGEINTMRQCALDVIGCIRRAANARPRETTENEDIEENDNQRDDSPVWCSSQCSDEAPHQFSDAAAPLTTVLPGTKIVCNARSVASGKNPGKKPPLCRCDIKGRVKYIDTEGNVRFLKGCCPSCNAAGCGCRECGVDQVTVGDDSFQLLQNLSLESLRLSKTERRSKLKAFIASSCLVDSTSKRWRWDWRVQCRDDRGRLFFVQTCVRGLARAFGLSHNAVDACKREIKQGIEEAESAEHILDDSAASLDMVKSMELEARKIYTVAMSADLASLAQMPNTEWGKEAYAWIKCFVELVSILASVEKYYFVYCWLISIADITSD
jgi:hypothetical protein